MGGVGCESLREGRCGALDGLIGLWLGTEGSYLQERIEQGCHSFNNLECNYNSLAIYASLL